jgi:nitrate/nitrite-specific signal transduction histidine kinase
MSILSGARLLWERGTQMLLPLSLGRRIVGSVAIGLALILLGFSVVAVWSIQQVTESAYSERVALAQALVWHVDDILGYSLGMLETEAATLSVQPGESISQQEAARLSDAHSDLSQFETLTLLDASATIVWSEPARPNLAIGQQYPDPAIVTVLTSNSPQIQQLAVPDTQRAVANLAVPVRGAGGQPVGVLAAEIDPGQRGLNLLPVRPVGNSIQVHLMNSDGWILAGSAQDSFEEQMDQSHAALLADLIQRHVSGYRIHDPPPMQTGDGHVISVNSHIVAYAPISLLPTWGVVVEQPQDVALASPRELEIRLALAGACMLLLAGTVAWLDVRRVVRPLERLTAAARRFAAGDLQDPIRLDRSYELGVLAHAFETMRQRLRDSLAEVSQWNRELERRVAARTSEVERRNRELANLNAIAAAVSSTLDSGPLLERSLDRILEITGADKGCFHLSDGTSAGPDIADEQNAPPDVNGSLSCCSACQVSGIRSCVKVPLEVGHRTEGVLFLASYQADYFDRINRATLSAMGRQVGMGLVNARLFENLRARERERAELLQRIIAGQEEERRRLAQELHDQTSQALASIQLGLDRLAAGVDRRDEARHVASELRVVAEQTLDAVHHLAVELRPSVLDDVGLVAALQRYLREWSEHTEMHFDFVPVGVEGLRLMPAAETAVYRIIQAALTNVTQHADARHVGVILQRRGEKLIAVVEDDGRGFDAAAVRTRPLERRLGLAGMEERANLIGATLALESTPGVGSSVFLEVPLDVNAVKEEAEVQVNAVAASNPG